ncbi:MAG: Flp pilus assembly protein TadG [Halocynthiibacter sp.]|jgi:Flp pilus assembly protein TadG
MFSLKKALSRFRRDEGGFATIEFLIVFPVFVTLLLSGYESGILMIRQTMLERGVDLAVRDLRLGRMPRGDDGVVDDEDVRRAICNYAAILPNCLDAMNLELREVSTTTFAMPSTSTSCVDRSSDIRPVIVFEAGAPNALMVINACFVVNPLFPGAGLGAQLSVDSTGGYRLMSSSAFVIEP